MEVLGNGSFWLALIGGLLIGGVIGHWLGWRLSPRARTLAELQALQQRHEEYRREVSTHFSRTGELFAQMAESYRTTYQHLAEGSERLADGGRTLGPLSQNPLLTHAAPQVPPPARTEPDES
jgi:uncharacterized membrane-anchored protein YhcB (DUF1043 family)